MSLLANNHYVYTADVQQLLEVIETLSSIIYRSTPAHFLVYPSEGCKTVEFRECEDTIDPDQLPTTLESLTINNTRFGTLDLSRFPRLKYLTINEGWLSDHSLGSSRIIGWNHAHSLLDLTVQSPSLDIPAKVLELPHIERVDCLKLSVVNQIPVRASQSLTYIAISRSLSPLISFDLCTKLRWLRLQLPDQSRLDSIAQHIDSLKSGCEGQIDAHTNRRPYMWEYRFKKIHGDNTTLWRQHNPLSLAGESTRFTSQ
jgi:hypothetical protein